MWMITDVAESLKEDFPHKYPVSCDYVSANCHVCNHWFRVLDDDGFVCFWGLSSDCMSEEAFAPLDDYGKGDLGCTSIEYYNFKTHDWEVL